MNKEKAMSTWEIFLLNLRSRENDQEHVGVIRTDESLWHVLRLRLMSFILIDIFQGCWKESED